MTGSLHHINVVRLMEQTHTAEFVLLKQFTGAEEGKSAAVFLFC
jgi:hypothetical protein